MMPLVVLVVTCWSVTVAAGSLTGPNNPLAVPQPDQRITVENQVKNDLDAAINYAEKTTTPHHKNGSSSERLTGGACPALISPSDLACVEDQVAGGEWGETRICLCRDSGRNVTIICGRDGTWDTNCKPLEVKDGWTTLMIVELGIICCVVCIACSIYPIIKCKKNKCRVPSFMGS